MFRSFDDISQDIGTELKQTARRIYNTSRIVAIVVMAISFLAVVIATEMEDFGLIFLTLIGAGLEGLIIVGSAYMIAIRLYAKGEMVHLNAAIAENTSGAQPAAKTPAAKTPAAEVPAAAQPAQKPAPAAPAVQPAAPATEPEPDKPQVKANGQWVCTCGRTNQSYTSSCCCGASKWDILKLIKEQQQ